jgi:protein-tyrosine phosphatase
MAAEARAILEGMALVDKGHVGRQLTADLVRRADLVLTATREHRREVVELDPTAGQRSFTIREFGYVVLHANDEWLKSCGVQAHDCALRAAVATVAAHRGVIPPADPEEFDVADPFGGSLKDYAEAAIRMLPAIQATSEYLVGAGAMDRIKAATEERPKLLGDATAA